MYKFLHRYTAYNTDKEKTRWTQMFSDRANAICLLEILKEYSDDEHIMAMKEIIKKMNTLYGLKPDRRTVYSAVALLIDLGYDISVYEDNGIGYYLRSRQFEQAEIHLLTDAVYTFPFIPAKQSEELIRKLQGVLSVHKRKNYRHLTIAPKDRKTENRQVFLNIELLDEAITRKKQVTFTYLKYGFDKKLYPRMKKPYVVNPHSMVYINEHYYLVCNYPNVATTNFYRLDRMKDIRISDKDLDVPFDNDKEIIKSVYAFVGKSEHIRMHCDNIVLDDVIDKFGSDITIRPLDENKFELVVKVPPNGIEFWALQYLSYVEVIEPKWLRDKIIESLGRNKYNIR